MIVSEENVSMWNFILLQIYHKLLPVQAAYHEPLVSAWFEIVSTDYKDSKYISSNDAVSEADARTNALWVL